MIVKAVKLMLMTTDNRASRSNSTNLTADPMNNTKGLDSVWKSGPFAVGGLR